MKMLEAIMSMDSDCLHKLANGKEVEPPAEVFRGISEDLDGHIGGTIRDGSIDEYFVLGTLIFNINEAREMSGMKANGTVPVDKAWSEGITVNPHHAAKRKSKNPVFIGQIPTKSGVKRVLIDGHHRMFRAVDMGETELDAHIFTPEETVSLMEAPPDVLGYLQQCLKSEEGTGISSYYE